MKQNRTIFEENNIMLGLKRGTVELAVHQKEWEKNALETIEKLRRILGKTAIDIQHVGSTAIPSIQAKPIIDLVIGARKLEDMQPYIECLEKNGFIFRGEDISGQMLFVAGDQDSRTHHIHVVEWNKTAWNNYINFRDYLKAFPEKARMYEECKKRLASQFPEDRKSYTAGKQELIEKLLNEASEYRT